MTKPQEKALNKLAKYYASDYAKAKGVFPKRHFKAKDILKMIKNHQKVLPTLTSLIHTASVIRAHDVNNIDKAYISKDQFEALNHYIIQTLGMDDWGIATFNEEEIFKGMGIPYKHVIVMSRHMDKELFKVDDLPNMEL